MAATSRSRDRAVGMLSATAIIAAAWATVEGLGTDANPGILAGPVAVALAVLVPRRRRRPSGVPVSHASAWRRFRWRLAHPDHPKYHGATITQSLTGMRCCLPTGHEGLCTNSSRSFSWENRWRVPGNSSDVDTPIGGAQ